MTKTLGIVLGVLAGVLVILGIVLAIVFTNGSGSSGGGSGGSSGGGSLNPYDDPWKKCGDSVVIIDEGTKDAQKTLDSILSTQGASVCDAGAAGCGVINLVEDESKNWTGQWAKTHYAILIKEGEYPDLNVGVGYYTSVIGVGAMPEDVKLGGGTGRGLYCDPGAWNYTQGTLSNFWRSAENVQTAGATWTATSCSKVSGDGTSKWCVSQAAPTRRINFDSGVILGSMTLDCEDAMGYASGGFIADSIMPTVTCGSQQQFCFRNCTIDEFPNVGEPAGPAVCAWNTVLIGCDQPLTDATKTVSVKENTPRIAEKPYIIFKDNAWYLMKPEEEENTNGATYKTRQDTEILFDKVYIATPDDNSSSINEKLSAGTHIIFSPGEYTFTEPLIVNQDNTIIYGMGIPVLKMNTDATDCILVKSGLTGIRMSGLLIQATAKSSNSNLLTIGDTGATANDCYYYDIFTRSGGPDSDPVGCEAMMVIKDSDVVVDDTWLWRADHGINGEKGPWDGNGIGWDNNISNYGLRVEANANNVICYGLASEHNQKCNCLWNGDDGEVYFYQCEIPYDVPADAEGVAGDIWDIYGFDNGGSGITIYGGGVYTFFAGYAMDGDNENLSKYFQGYAKAGFNLTSPKEIKAIYGRWLNGYGGLENVSIIDGTEVGGKVFCSVPGDDPGGCNWKSCMYSIMKYINASWCADALQPCDPPCPCGTCDEDPGDCCSSWSAPESFRNVRRRRKFHEGFGNVYRPCRIWA